MARPRLGLLGGGAGPSCAKSAAEAEGPGRTTPAVGTDGAWEAARLLARISLYTKVIPAKIRRLKISGIIPNSAP